MQPSCITEVPGSNLDQVQFSYLLFVTSDVLTAVMVKDHVFWDVTSCR